MTKNGRRKKIVSTNSGEGVGGLGSVRVCVREPHIQAGGSGKGHIQKKRLVIQRWNPLNGCKTHTQKKRVVIQWSMATFCLCMIVRDEQDNLARCLDSVQGVFEEIVIVDTGSVDDTVSIAKRYTDKVHFFAWCDDFAKARNFAFGKATCDYIMWLDADDVVSVTDRQKLIQLKTQTNGCEMVVCRYHLRFDTAGEVVYFSRRERLFLRSAGKQWVGAVHECIPIGGKVLYREDIAICHKPPNKDYKKSNARNLRIYQKMLRQGALDSRGLYYYARELRDAKRYGACVTQLKKFLKRGDGWVEDNIGACLMLAGIYQKESKTRAVKVALQTMEYDCLRAEACCFLGYLYKESGELRRACDWFLMATKTVDKGAGFGVVDNRGYVPWIELCVCHEKLGQRDKAIHYNELAGEVKPYGSEYLYNKKYFDTQAGKA